MKHNYHTLADMMNIAARERDAKPVTVAPLSPAEAEEKLKVAIGLQAQKVVDHVLTTFNGRMTDPNIASRFEVEARNYEGAISTTPSVLDAALAMVRERLAEKGWDCSVTLKRRWYGTDYDKPTFVFRSDR